MILKTFNITLGVLVALTVWSAALMVLLYALFFAVLALHVVVMGGFTVYHLMNS